MSQNIQISVSFDETYVDQFLVVVNNIYTLHSQAEHQSFNSRSNVDGIVISDTLEFFICYNGKLKNLFDIQQRIKTKFPKIIFHFKHIPTEYPLLEEFLLNNYPFERAKSYLKNCSVYYRMFLDIIWPDLNGLVLQIDLDLIFQRDVKSLFELVIDMQQQAKRILYACPCTGKEIYCWDLKHSIIRREELEQWTQVKGELVLQHYFNAWVNWFIECGNTVNGLVDINYFKAQYTKVVIEKQIHFNAGVLMFDITNYRKNNIQQICRDCIVLHKKFDMFFNNDQGILNFVFFGKVGVLPDSWNFLHYGCGYRYIIDPTVIHKKNFDESNVIHFNGPYKPWNDSDTDKIPQHALTLWKKYQI